MRDYVDTIFALMEYEMWCNFRTLDFLEKLSDEDLRRDFGFGLRTPHRTIFHIADVLQGWCHSVGPVVQSPSWITYDDATTLQDIRTIVRAAGKVWLEAAESSHEAGVLGEDRRLSHVLHLVTHGTHHRGQLLSMFTLMGHRHPFEGGDFGGWLDAPD
jgi:uncharacterized damage-inducible protein DinB